MCAIAILCEPGCSIATGKLFVDSKECHEFEYSQNAAAKQFVLKCKYQIGYVVQRKVNGFTELFD